MCPFIDTSAFVAFINKKDKNHKRAKEIFADIRNGKYLGLSTNDYVLDESVTLVRTRTKRYDLALKVAHLIMNSKLIRFEYVRKDDIDKVIDIYGKHKDKDLSFTDWILYISIKTRGMKMIIAFDKHFDQVDLERIF